MRKGNILDGTRVRWYVRLRREEDHESTKVRKREKEGEPACHISLKHCPGESWRPRWTSTRRWGRGSWSRSTRRPWKWLSHIGASSSSGRRRSTSSLKVWMSACSGLTWLWAVRL